MTSEETPATPTPECPPSGSKKNTSTMLGIVFWMIIGALLFNTLLPKQVPKQGLRITNTGEQSVAIRNLARWSWNEEELTLHPGATGIWSFANVEHFQISVSDESPPEPGATPPESFVTTRAEMWPAELHQNEDGSSTIMLRHVDRTAEVRVNDAGKIEFVFTDL